MTLLKLASSDLVVPAWINTIPAFTDRSGGICATTLPTDNTTWGASGFVVMHEIGGGDNAYLPEGEPVVQLDVWVTSPKTGKPTWWKASSIMQTIIAATRSEADLRRHLTLTAGGQNYGTAMVGECSPLGPTRKHEDDAGQYAHLSHDFHFHWWAL